MKWTMVQKNIDLGLYFHWMFERPRIASPFWFCTVDGIDEIWKSL